MLLNLLRSNWIVALAVIAVLGGAIYLRRTQPPVAAPPAPDVNFSIVGPAGEPIVVQLPELAKVPPLDLAAACKLVAAQNEKMRAANRALVDAAHKSIDISYSIRDAAETTCANTGGRDFGFYDALASALNAPTQESRADAYQAMAALREALRVATSAQEVAETLRALAVRAAIRADRLHAPDLFLIGAEVSAVRVQYCDLERDENAAQCRVTVHMKRGEDLFDAGRWRADSDLLRASIAAMRDALRDATEKSWDWIELHARVGSAFAQLSEQTSGDPKRALLRQALEEYEIARRAVDASAGSTLAMIDQNVCSVRQPLAAMDKDREETRRAIAECERARVYYAKNGEKTNEAAAHYNMARAFEKLAAWDKDEAAAFSAVEHVRRSVQLYSEDGATMSVAFGQVHLAGALIDASEFVQRRSDGESQETRRTLIAEARASLDAAEPILRDARAAGYLASLQTTRRRLERDGI